MCRKQYLIILVVLAASAMICSPAFASPFDVYAPPGRSASMSGAQTANAEGATAVYDNPAALAGVDPGVSAGTFATAGHAPILLKDRPDGYDVPDLGSRSPALPSDQTRNQRRDTDTPEPLYGFTGGVITDFGGTDTRGAVLVMVPTNGLLVQQTYFADERERYFSNQLHHEVIGSRLHRPVIEMGVARQLTERISAGIGGTYLPGTAVSTEGYVADPSDQSDVDLNTQVNTVNQWGLLAGLTAELPGDFSAGVAFRQGVAFEMEGTNEVQVRGMPDESTQQLNWVPVSTPSSLRAGVAWNPGDIEWAADARYTFWSNYVDSHGEDAGFHNTIQGRLGAEWTYSEETRLRAGVGFVPTPVPEQTGRTNYVDNSRAMASIGGGHQFTFAERALEASWHLQFHHLILRDTDKEPRNSYPDCAPGETALCDEVPDDLEDPETGQPYDEAQGLQTGNPGFPGFVSGGWLASVGLELRY